MLDARSAMPDGGVIEISTSASRTSLKHDVQISIRDFGKGLRPGAQERIFDPYYQSRPGNRNPGFSLALVYQFVAVSGGTIEVESHPGEGTAWRLSFPAIENPNILELADSRIAASA
jgi:signal transduction histidine kinase